MYIISAKILKIIRPYQNGRVYALSGVSVPLILLYFDLLTQTARRMIIQI